MSDSPREGAMVSSGSICTVDGDTWVEPAELTVDDDGYAQSNLLSRARAQDRAALGELLMQFKPQLLTRALWKIGPRLRRQLDADDLVNLTFIEATKAFAGFGGEVRQFRTWLETILDRQLIAILKRKKLPEESVSPSNDVVLNAAAEMLTPSQHTLALELLARLPEKQRDVVDRHYRRKCTLEEIAGELEMTRGAVAGHLRRGLARLRTIVAESHN